MTRGKTGAGEGEQYGDEQSSELHQSVNDRSLLILQVISRLNTRFPQETDVNEIVGRLHAEDDKSWDWLRDLGIIRGEPGHGQLTDSGKRVVDHASLAADFRGALENCERLSKATDRHAAAVLALLYTNYEQRYSGES
ncbi:MAG: hypothetical protein GY948_18275 [Alphaproteobacteria bacterium]|nr:hypothetical protein [Alphaproteobacteria bacterium]